MIDDIRGSVLGGQDRVPIERRPLVLEEFALDQSGLVAHADALKQSMHLIVPRVAERDNPMCVPFGKQKIEHRRDRLGGQSQSLRLGCEGNADLERVRLPIKPMDCHVAVQRAAVARPNRQLQPGTRSR